jgi:hypothetical protein
VSDWAAHFERERERYEDGQTRLSALEDPDDRQRQLTRMGNAAAGAGLALIMARRRAEAAEWLARAAEHYRESFADAPPGSWGRPIGAVKARLLAGDRPAAEDDARWTLDAGAAGAAGTDSPIGRYAACLALLVLARDGEAAELAESLRGQDDFPADVAEALAAIAASDQTAYRAAVGAVLRSFEARDEYLEDLPVADTVVVLQALAAPRGLEVELDSSLLPPG